jgi:ABC-type polysaccharide/polyol phosphate transport system ATPase subunit
LWRTIAAPRPQPRDRALVNLTSVPNPAQGPAVVVDGLSKRFQIPAEQVHTLKERALHPFRRQRFNRFDALHDVSFSVPRGEFFGIVGRNGSGKSTLLKCLAGIYRADAGRVLVDGRLATFIELGVGFNPDLAARDNVIINGVMLGLSPAAARERFEHVLEFSELHEFVDLKLKNYSSGMQVRLAFSVAIQVDADVLLIDEVLAVGDAAFQQKCFDEFHRLRDEGKTMLFVTHDMGAVVRFCHRAMLIERGRTRFIGEPDEVASRYLETNFNRDEAAAESPSRPMDRFGDGRAEIVRAWFEGSGGEQTQTVRQGHECVFRAQVRFSERVVNPIFGVGFENAERQYVFATNSTLVREETGTFEAGDEAVFSVRLENVFAPGRIFATPAVAHEGGGGQWIDRRERFVSVVSTASRDLGAIVAVPHDFQLQRQPAASNTVQA